jgi:hypothetical protein
VCPCPQPECTGVLHSKGRNRSPVCNICGKGDRSLPMGRPRIPKPPKPLKGPKPLPEGKRSVVYALFDRSLMPDGYPNWICRECAVETTIGCHRKRVQALHPGFMVVPIGSLSKKEKAWFIKARSCDAIGP